MDANEVDAEGWGPLHHAAKAGDAGAIRTLLEAGANPLQLVPSGEAPLDLVRRFAPDHSDANIRLEAAVAGAHDVPPTKDPDREHIVPTAWRPRIVQIVDAFVRGDYALSCGIEGVKAAAEVADNVKYNVSSYGEPLVALPEETWNTSAAQWWESHWRARIDLWTASGPSDLVLFVHAWEIANGRYELEVHLVYVP